MIASNQLKKAYGDHVILDIKSLGLTSGIYWLKGSNGAGKSTVMKIIAGMIPFDGDINLFDTSLKEKPVHYRRMVSYAAAEPLFPPFLTGYDLISLYKHTRDAKQEDIDVLQEAFSVNSFIKNPVNTYSSGMVKKLSLILAFIGDVKLILLDEPLVTIDKNSIPVLSKLISSYAARGTNFIIASHQLLELQDLPPLTQMSIIDHQLSFA